MGPDANMSLPYHIQKLDHFKKNLAFYNNQEYLMRLFYILILTILPIISFMVDLNIFILMYDSMYIKIEYVLSDHSSYNIQVELPLPKNTLSPILERNALTKCKMNRHIISM